MIRNILIGLSAVIILAGSAASQEKSPYAKYLENPTSGTFIGAYNYYESERSDTSSDMAAIMLAYLHMEEMNRNIEMLKGNIGDLGIMPKFNYANILLELGRYSEAIEAYRQLNSDNPEWSCPWRHRGEAHWKSGEHKEAVACLEKAIETRETHFDAYTQLAEVLADMKEYARALEVLEKGLTFYKKDIEDPEREVSMIDIEFLYLKLLMENGRIEDADTQRKMLEKTAPGDERLK
ncbi:MAG: tetratricopeptide repeat protein [Candidatus Krumholzibacteriota bacterium]|nr:tetratricopeptide repeat protein [Candidatus Krumholzibacteriota bacterium]